MQRRRDAAMALPSLETKRRREGWAEFLIVLILLGSGTICGAAEVSVWGGLEVRVDGGTGEYRVSADNPAWSLAGSMAGGAQDVQTDSGTDRIGDYNEVSFGFHDGATPLKATIRVYGGKAVALFTLEYPSGAEHPLGAFPDFTSVPGPAHVFSYRDTNFSPAEFRAEKGGSPWLIFDDQYRAAIVSPASHFFIQELAGNGHERIASRLKPKLTGIPAGFAQQTLVAIGQGINSTWNTWGEALVLLGGKTPPANDADPGLKYLGYWTDNGASYYYNYDAALGYAGTLLKLEDYFKQQGIPVGYMQLDSWWYYKTLRGPDGKMGKTKNPKLPEGEWNRYGGLLEYKAHPAVIPQGLAEFQKELGIPLITHNRWIDPESPYRHDYQFTGLTAIDPKYWDMIMGYLQSGGVMTYEQDWLNQMYLHSPALGSTVDAGDEFMNGMADAAKDHGVTMQYCMGLPCNFLQGSRYGNLTSIRTSDDRFGPSRWRNFLYTSRLAWSIGTWPWGDTYMSTEIDNLLLSNLSAGMVGFGDLMGKESKANLLKAVRADGVIVKPDAPVVPIDRSYVEEVSDTKTPLIAETYTDHDGMRTVYVFAYGKPKMTARITPNELGIDGTAYVYDYFADQVHSLGTGESFDAPLNSDGVGYFIIASPGESGFAFFGDRDMFVSNGRQRVASLEENPERLTAGVILAKGEQSVRLHGCNHRKPTIKVIGGTASDLTYDAGSQHFDFKVTADNSAPASPSGGDLSHLVTVELTNP
jgi:hypothetical protein